MISEFTAALASVKAITEFTALASKIKNDSAIANKAIELQAQILALQSAIMSIQAECQRMTQEKYELEQKLKQMEDWDADASNYELKPVGRGAFVYIVKTDQNSAKSGYWLCANCFEQKKKSILQAGPNIGSGLNHHNCPQCKARIFT